MKTWKASDIENAELIGELEIEIPGGHTSFTVMASHDRLVFGGACNAGFLESGFMKIEDGDTADSALRELQEELEIYYGDGAQYVSRIVCNERM